MNFSIDELIGPNSTEIEWWQMLIRAVSVFFIALVMVRLGGTRIFGKNTSFDIVLGIVLGSILSRAITGNSPFFPTVVASGALVFLHWAIAYISFNHRPVGILFKGKETLLVENGEYLWDNMKKSQITSNDILESLRIKGNIKIEKVKFAYLERGGDISIIL